MYRSASEAHLIPKQFFKRISRFGLPGNVLRGRDELAADHVEIFAVIGQVLFRNRVSPAVPALLRHARVIAHAIQTDLQIRAAETRLGPAWGSGQRIFPAALPAMSRRNHDGILHNAGPVGYMRER